MVSGGCIIAGLVRDSVLGRNVLVHPGAVVEECVILDNCEIGPGAALRRTILDKNARVPAGERIGFDREHDRQRHHVSDSGIVVVTGTRSPVELAAVGI
jgi:glucose-1-phosphate adenylyltransferase